MRPLVLASRSPIRAKMLADAGIEVQVRASPLDEDGVKRRLVAQGADARELAGGLAVAKAQAVIADPGELVVGADQTLELAGRVFDKPGNVGRLRDQLARLQGRSHTLHSAAALVKDGEVVWSGVSSVRMLMRALNASELERYVEAEGAHVLECVGGYRVEGLGVQLFEAVEGEYFAVLGLPLLGILKALRAMGTGDWQD